jgi:hypothetical protein
MDVGGWFNEENMMNDEEMRVKNEKKCFFKYATFDGVFFFFINFFASSPQLRSPPTRRSPPDLR